jgi:hypothetical protein
MPPQTPIAGCRTHDARPSMSRLTVIRFQDEPGQISHRSCAAPGCAIAIARRGNSTRDTRRRRTIDNTERVRRRIARGGSGARHQSTPRARLLASSPPATRNTLFGEIRPSCRRRRVTTSCAPPGRARPPSAVTARQMALTSRAGARGGTPRARPRVVPPARARPRGMRSRLGLGGSGG